MTDTAAVPALPVLSISPETVFDILLKARELDEKVELVDPASGSNPGDDLAVDILQEDAEDATAQELAAAIRRLNEDEQKDLVALIWIGRGDFALQDWPAARESAADIGRSRMVRYVTGMPLVSDYLEEAMSRFGQSMSDYLDAH